MLSQTIRNLLSRSLSRKKSRSLPSRLLSRKSRSLHSRLLSPKSRSPHSRLLSPKNRSLPSRLLSQTSRNLLSRSLSQKRSRSPPSRSQSRTSRSPISRPPTCMTMKLRLSSLLPNLQNPQNRMSHLRSQEGSRRLLLMLLLIGQYRVFRLLLQLKTSPRTLAKVSCNTNSSRSMLHLMTNLSSCVRVLHAVRYSSNLSRSHPLQGSPVI